MQAQNDYQSSEQRLMEVWRSTYPTGQSSSEPGFIGPKASIFLDRVVRAIEECRVRDLNQFQLRTIIEQALPTHPQDVLSTIAELPLQAESLTLEAMARALLREVAYDLAINQLTVAQSAAQQVFGGVQEQSRSRQPVGAGSR